MCVAHDRSENPFCGRGHTLCALGMEAIPLDSRRLYLGPRSHGGLSLTRETAIALVSAPKFRPSRAHLGPKEHVVGQFAR